MTPPRKVYVRENDFYGGSIVLQVDDRTVRDGSVALIWEAYEGGAVMMELAWVEVYDLARAADTLMKHAAPHIHEMIAKRDPKYRPPRIR